MQFVKFSILVGLTLVLLCSCESVFREPPETTQAITTTLPEVEQAKTVKSYGSLWSSTSSWNNIYTASSSRAEGDLLEVKLGGSVRARIEDLRRKLLREKYGDENFDPKKKDEGVLAGEKEEPQKKMVIEPLPNAVQAVIKEVGQKGIYRISAFETIKVGDDEPRLILEGLVRDRDIDADDKLSSDSMYGVRLELRPRTLQPTSDPKVASAGGASNVSW